VISIDCVDFSSIGNPDTDGDGILDGTELGLAEAQGVSTDPELFVPVLENRLLEGEDIYSESVGQRWIVAVRAFHDPPAVVSTFPKDVYFLEKGLTHVGNKAPLLPPQVEGVPPRITKAIRVNFGPGTGSPDKGILRRDAVRQGRVDINSQYFPKQVRQHLGIAKWSVRIPDPATVTRSFLAF